MSDSEDEECQRKAIKIGIVGEPLTGKSSLCNRYLGGNGSSNGSTHGAEVMAGQCLELRPPVPLQICDIAGNTLTTPMLKNYLYDSDIILFVYDLSNLQSFEKLKDWFTTVKDISENEPKKPLMALFGNKSDLEHQRAVRLSSVQKFASAYLLENFKGSAKTGDKVNNAFTSLVARVLGIKTPNVAAPYVKPILVPVQPELDGVPVTRQEPATRKRSLIMNRKALRRIQRNASSSVCCLQ